MRLIKNKYFIITLLIILAFIFYSYDKHKENVSLYSDAFANSMVTKVGGGNDIQFVVNDWKYKLFTKTYIIDLDVSYEGRLLNNNDYTFGGTLIVDKSGNEVSFTRKRQNENFAKVIDVIDFTNVFTKIK